MENIKNIKLFLLDMDGTLYLGDQLFDGTIDFLRHVQADGGRYIFLTNRTKTLHTGTRMEAIIPMGDSMSIIMRDWIVPVIWDGLSIIR